MRRALAGVRRLSWRDRVELMKVMIISVLVEVGVRVLPLPVMARWCSVALADREQNELRRLADLPDWARQRVLIARRVIRRWPIDGTCLRQSLLVGQRLRSLDPKLHIGVRADDGSVSAHAWIEVLGGALDPTALRYEQLLVAGIEVMNQDGGRPDAAGDRADGPR